MLGRRVQRGQARMAGWMLKQVQHDVVVRGRDGGLILDGLDQQDGHTSYGSAAADHSCALTFRTV